MALSPFFVGRGVDKVMFEFSKDTLSNPPMILGALLALAILGGTESVFEARMSERGARGNAGSSPTVEPGVTVCDLGKDALPLGIGELNRDDGAT